MPFQFLTILIDLPRSIYQGSLGRFLWDASMRSGPIHASCFRTHFLAVSITSCMGREALDAGGQLNSCPVFAPSSPVVFPTFVFIFATSSGSSLHTFVIVRVFHLAHFLLPPTTVHSSAHSIYFLHVSFPVSDWLLLVILAQFLPSIFRGILSHKPHRPIFLKFRCYFFITIVTIISFSFFSSIYFKYLTYLFIFFLFIYLLFFFFAVLLFFRGVLTRFYCSFGWDCFDFLQRFVVSLCPFSLLWS